MSVLRRATAAACAGLTACSLWVAAEAPAAAAQAAAKPAPAGRAAAAPSLPARPSDLRFPPLSFTVPQAETYRHVLANGVVVYLVEDHTLPVVDVELHSRLGSFLDPAGKVGVAEMTGSMLRQGGAGDWTAEQLDERADFLAAELSSEAGDTSGDASVNCLASALDDCLDLLFTMVQRPRFQQDRLDVAKSNLTEEMKQRNDQAEEIQGREWQWLLYGTEHFTSRLPTAASLAALSRDDLVAFHRDYWRPENLVVAVAGDVQAAGILPKLEQRFATWPAGKGAPVPWPPPPPRFTPTPGLYHVEKDIPQARVSMGHLGAQWDKEWSDPHAFAALVMNDILGGGGFTSHITKRIRSDEGLAYSAGSRFDIGAYWPGTFRVSFQSKNETAAYAAKIALEEIRAMQAKPPTAEELRVSKGSFVESFPRRFDSPQAVANLFVGDDLLGRPHDYWQRYRERIGAVTAADVQAAAQEALHPDRLVVLVVGPWAPVAAGDPQGHAKMESLGLGEVHHLPLRDPLTLEPKPAP